MIGGRRSSSKGANQGATLHVVTGYRHFRRRSFRLNVEHAHTPDIDVNCAHRGHQHSLRFEPAMRYSVVYGPDDFKFISDLDALLGAPIDKHNVAFGEGDLVGGILAR